MGDKTAKFEPEAYKKECVLRELYLAQDHSLERVSEILGTTRYKVTKWCEKHGIEKTARTRFESKYTVDSESGCWEWGMATDKDGYGVFSENNEYIRAHRFSHKEYNGDIPEGEFVLHNCDNPSCVNPDHLRSGTHLENMSDAKDRSDTFGTEKQRDKVRKLNKNQVVEIRTRYHNNDVSMVDLATEYGVSDPTIHELLHGDTWSDVDGPTLS